MYNRTDLAVEKIEESTKSVKGINETSFSLNDVSVTRTIIESNSAAKSIGKPKGRYITLQFKKLVGSTLQNEKIAEVLAQELNFLLPESNGTILVAGLGNRDITPDSLGPRCTQSVLATRHIDSNLASQIGLNSLKSVAVLSPGVLGQTGIEVSEILAAVTQRISPYAVIVIDALAAKSINRLCTTIQLSDTGICPGSGVGNARKEISDKTLGVPVVAVGIPTVVDASTIVYDASQGKGFVNQEYEQMIVTPREIDMLIEHSSKLLALSINKALQPDISGEIMA